MRTRGAANLPGCLLLLKFYCRKQLTIVVWGCFIFYGIGTYMCTCLWIEVWSILKCLNLPLPSIFKTSTSSSRMEMRHVIPVTKVLQEGIQLLCFPWPVQSLDINVIENIWLLMTKPYIKTNISNIIPHGKTKSRSDNNLNVKHETSDAMFMSSKTCQRYYFKRGFFKVMSR